MMVLLTDFFLYPPLMGFEGGAGQHERTANALSVLRAERREVNTDVEESASGAIFQRPRREWKPSEEFLLMSSRSALRRLFVLIFLPR